jgi:hypothetical protein
MTPKRTRRNSRKRRRPLLPAVNGANRWVLFPGGGFGLIPKDAA